MQFCVLKQVRLQINNALLVNKIHKINCAACSFFNKINDSFMQKFSRLNLAKEV